MTTSFALAAVLAVATLLAAPLARAHADSHAGHGQSAAGRAGDPALAGRTVLIGMADTMRFSPARLLVERGETLRLVARNGGQAMHELVLGTHEEIGRHREAMRRNPQMPHEAPYMAHVKPGESGEIVWQFDRSGTFEYACLLPGHYEAGMSGSIVVRE